MPRPLTKGPPIQFRLSLEDAALLAELALKEGWDGPGGTSAFVRAKVEAMIAKARASQPADSGRLRPRG